MGQVRVIVEFSEQAQGAATMRWERTALTENAGAFLLLGRAFEVMQRDSGTAFPEALMAFMQGAMIQRGDVAEVLGRVEDGPRKG